MTRTYMPAATPDVKSSLEVLLQDSPAEDYRQAMTVLGTKLGELLRPELASMHSVLVVCTVEDADWLTRGLLGAIDRRGLDVHLSCFWNRRYKTGITHKVSVAPVVRRYEEPIHDRVDAVIVTKSIISNGCVVKTNLMEVLEKHRPGAIFIAAPVMSDSAEASLSAEFPRDISSRFKFCFFAMDSRDPATDAIAPGIGGDVYVRLGFKGQDDKNSYRPSLVKERTSRLRAAPSPQMMQS